MNTSGQVSGGVLEGFIFLEIREDRVDWWNAFVDVVSLGQKGQRRHKGYGDGGVPRTKDACFVSKDQTCCLCIAE